MERPFFSIVIPTYNRGDIIKRSIDSIYAQYYDNWEIIVVDNCSTDNTAKVIEPYLSSRKIRYVVNDKNYERSYSRNKGMRLAAGDFITLLDSDDILYPDCLQKAAAFISANPESVFFHCLYEILDDNYKVRKRPVFPPIENPYAAIAKGNFISNIGVFYSNDLVKQVHFDEEPIIIGIEDYDFVLNVLLHTSELQRVNAYCCGVYDHAGRSVHAEKWERTLSRVQYFVNKQLENPLFQRKMGSYKNSFLAHTDLYLVSFCAVRKMKRRAFKYILKSFFQYPGIVTELTFYKHLFVILKNIF